MTGKERAEVLERIHGAVLEYSYTVTDHAWVEMEADNLDLVDLESAILTGTIQRVFEDDPEERRYEIIGKACDLTTDVGVVVRFAGSLLVITVYEKRPI